MITLYATHTGSRYHRTPVCTGLNSYDMSTCMMIPVPVVTRSEAVRRGLTPCKTCQPAPLLRLIAS